MMQPQPPQGAYSPHQGNQYAPPSQGNVQPSAPAYNHVPQSVQPPNQPMYNGAASVTYVC